MKWFKTLRWPTGEAYLRRWMLTPEANSGRKCPWRLYLHNIVRPDHGRHPHDHPSWFVTIVLRGGYVEAVFDDRGRFVRTERRRRGQVIYRPATYVHRIVSVDRGTWTLSLWGRYTRQWGFYVDGQFMPEYAYPRTPEQME